MIWASSSRSSRGLTAFTLPCVPTGIKAGVLITPCAVVMRPRRAFVCRSCARSSNIFGSDEKFLDRDRNDKSACKYSLQVAIFPLCFAFTAQGRESLLRGLSGLFVARITTSGGALWEKVPTSNQLIRKGRRTVWVNSQSA